MSERVLHLEPLAHAAVNTAIVAVRQPELHKAQHRAEVVAAAMRERVRKALERNLQVWAHPSASGLLQKRAQFGVVAVGFATWTQSGSP